MYQSISKKLAPTGILRIAINTSNFLLVSGKNEQGIPTGISPDLGRKIAEELNLKFKYIKFKNPPKLLIVLIKIFGTLEILLLIQKEQQK